MCDRKMVALKEKNSAELSFAKSVTYTAVPEAKQVVEFLSRPDMSFMYANESDR